jgi:hypothetical protein
LSCLLVVVYLVPIALVVADWYSRPGCILFIIVTKDWDINPMLILVSPGPGDVSVWLSLSYFFECEKHCWSPRATTWGQFAACHCEEMKPNLMSPPVTSDSSGEAEIVIQDIEDKRFGLEPAIDGVESCYLCCTTYSTSQPFQCPPQLQFVNIPVVQFPVLTPVYILLSASHTSVGSWARVYVLTWVTPW